MHLHRGSYVSLLQSRRALRWCRSWVWVWMQHMQVSLVLGQVCHWASWALPRLTSHRVGSKVRTSMGLSAIADQVPSCTVAVVLAALSLPLGGHPLGG